VNRSNKSTGNVGFHKETKSFQSYKNASKYKGNSFPLLLVSYAIIDFL
jgi:hypothetical protein